MNKQKEGGWGGRFGVGGGTLMKVRTKSNIQFDNEIFINTSPRETSITNNSPGVSQDSLQQKTDFFKTLFYFIYFLVGLHRLHLYSLFVPSRPQV
jgi:hypothetical protein